MAFEIERKFLVIGEAWRSCVASRARLRQAYLATDGKLSVRIRASTPGKAYLTIKTAVPGTRRSEFEYEIPAQDAEELLALRASGEIEKYRHDVEVGGHRWEVDEFVGDNAGLIVAEIELSHPDESFEHPSWLGREITMEEKYYNASLARHPFKTWSLR